MTRIALVIASAALLSACGMWDRITGGGESAAAGSTSPDARLMRDIAEANAFEIATGKLAVSKAQSGPVSGSASMVDEHTKMQSEERQKHVGEKDRDAERAGCQAPGRREEARGRSRARASTRPTWSRW